MEEGGLVKVNKLLMPFSYLYGVAVDFRNSLFDFGVLKSHSFPIPIIGVGNITCGGTGKTPFVEYILGLLHRKYRVATLSRGYKRGSKGYILAKLDTPMQLIGDEPWLIRQNFRNIYVAVDNDRVEGIVNLCNDEETKDVEAIVLDDAYQHRYVKPGLNILLVDYNRFITRDELLPAGRLREPAENKKRADIVVVTKCPRDLKPLNYRVMERSLDLAAFQDLFFSSISYGRLQGLFIDKERTLESISPQENVFLLTGIALPEQMEEDISRHTQQLTTLTFPDHHLFTPDDVRKINERFKALPQPRLAITTEKDATRLICTEGLCDEICESLYVLPVRVEILRGQAKDFNNKILTYVHKNQRNGRVVSTEA